MTETAEGTEEVCVITDEEGLVLEVNSVFERSASRRQVLSVGPPAGASSLVYSGPGSAVAKSHADHAIPHLADVGRSSLVR